MIETASKPIGLRHAVFLHRVTDVEPTSPSARLGQGAFLALRLIDLLAPDRAPVSDPAFEYQWSATDRYCSELVVEGTEAAHLTGLVGIARQAFRHKDSRLLAPELLAYAHYLEDDAHYEEALDVLDTLLQVGGDRLSQGDAVATQLRWARVLRKMARFDEADAAYAEAGAQAETAGDSYSVLLSRLGKANVLHGRGNLSGAERQYREILADARTHGHREVEARAEHGVGAALLVQGQPADAVPHVWRAFELYEDESSRLRALNDLGLMLLALGDAQGAERALLEVLRRGGSQDNANNALIELMHCASYRRDRVGFERWRTECEARIPTMAPNILADFYLKAGIGSARFGNFRKARIQLTTAVEQATANGLHEFEFRIERINAGLRDCEAEAARPVVAEPMESPELLEVSASLARLGG